MHDAAMMLVRGPLFAGLGRTDWTILEGVQARIEALIVETALHAAAGHIREGRAATAESLIRRALLVSPYDERLYRALLCATVSQGDRVRLPSTMAQLLTLAGAADAAPSWRAEGTGLLPREHPLHPQTAALYHRLLAGIPASG